MGSDHDDKQTMTEFLKKKKKNLALGTDIIMSSLKIDGPNPG